MSVALFLGFLLGAWLVGVATIWQHRRLHAEASRLRGELAASRDEADLLREALSEARQAARQQPRRRSMWD